MPYNKLDFRFLMKNYKDDNITEKDIDELYDRMSKGDKNGISFENFKKHSMWIEKLLLYKQKYNSYKTYLTFISNISNITLIFNITLISCIS